MEQNENDIESARGMSWCKIHKYWHDTGAGCPDCESKSPKDKKMLRDLCEAKSKRTVTIKKEASP